MKQWNYWPYITASFLAVAFMMTGMTIFIAVTKVPVELDGRFQMSYQDFNESYLDFQNQRDAFDQAGYKIKMELPKSLAAGQFNLLVTGPSKVETASLVISRPATNLDQLGPFKLLGDGSSFAHEITLPLTGCWVFDVKMKVNDWMIFERSSLFFNDAGELIKNRTCGRK